MTANLITTLGLPTAWRSAQEFGNAAMSGAVIPWLGVQLEGKTLPLSLRNGPAVVLDFWSDAKVHIADAMKRLSVFMAQRIEGGAFLPGPLHVIGRRGRSVRPVAAVLPSSDMHYLVVFCGADELPDIDKSIAEMKRLVRENADWGLVPSESLEGASAGQRRSAFNGGQSRGHHRCRRRDGKDDVAAYTKKEELSDRFHRRCRHTVRRDEGCGRAHPLLALRSRSSRNGVAICQTWRTCLAPFAIATDRSLMAPSYPT